MRTILFIKCNVDKIQSKEKGSKSEFLYIFVMLTVHNDMIYKFTFDLLVYKFTFDLLVY